MEKDHKLVITTGSWVRGILVIAIAYGLFLVSNYLLVIITAIVIASAIEPAARWAEKEHIPRLPMVILIYLFTALVLAGLFYFLLLPLIGDISSFIKTLTIYSNSAVNGGVLSDMFQSQNLFGGVKTASFVKDLSSNLNALSDFLSQGVFSSIAAISGGLLNFALIVVLSFYLVVQDDGITKFLKAVTPLPHEKYVVGLWRRSQRKIGLWMRGQLISSFLIMSMVYIGLLIFRVPHALLLAVLAGVLELIPLFGATLAAVPAVFIGYVAGGFNLALIVAGLYIVIQQAEGNLIYPLIVEKVVGVPPTISIIALVIGGALAGFLGVLVSVPTAAVIMELLSDFEEHKAGKVAKGESS